LPTSAIERFSQPDYDSRYQVITLCIPNDSENEKQDPEPNPVLPQTAQPEIATSGEARRAPDAIPSFALGEGQKNSKP
jgi:hypothetical protein